MTDVRFGCTSGKHLDMAIEEINKGNEVFVLHCDSSIGLCVTNAGKNPLLCKACEHFQKTDMKYVKGLKYEEHWIKEYVSKIDKKSLPKFSYNSAKELRALEYEGVEIGIGALSSYISLTRNLNPLINECSRYYFDNLLEEQVLTIKVLKFLQQKYQFNQFVFANGRGAQFKPFLNLCKQWKIDFWCTEWILMGNGKIFMDNFWCDHAHSHKAYRIKFDECWNNTTDSELERERVARSFFENRRNAKFSGDVIYTKNQQQGLMPDGWDDKLYNVVIFNSSQDEYAAIGKDIDKEALFPSHIIGVKKILDHYKNNKSIFFTLRIHPNLATITYTYQSGLYKLNYPNLRVIPGDSPVSSYSLIDAADKIIIFGSTIGIEAAYWGKPVITLDYVIYKDLGVVYKPESELELWEMIDNPTLPCLYNENALKYGYYIMSENHERTKHIDIDLYKRTICGRSYECANYQKFLGSNFLYSFIIKIFDRIKMKWPAVYKNIDFQEAI